MRRAEAGSGPVLIAGIGNVFLSDDGFGVEVAGRLAASPVPAGVRVADFGIRGIHLAYELLEGYDALVLVDAVPLGEPPGTLAVIQPELSGPAPEGMDAHSMSPELVITTLSRLGGSLNSVLVVGCQPASVEEGIGLSPAVEAAIEPAIQLCLDAAMALLGDDSRAAALTKTKEMTS